MPRADQSNRRQKPHRVGAPALGALIALLVLPSIALSRLAVRIDGWVLVAVPCAISLFSFFSYRSDKRRAEVGERRIPESTLHLVDFLGGWPGGFLAQRLFRHKTAKGSFQFVFWLVVLSHEYLAADSLLHWQLAQALLRFIRSVVA